MKTILITGASGGIGSRIACEVANEETFLVLQGRNRETLEAVKKKVLAKGAAAELWVSDFRRLHTEEVAKETSLQNVDIYIHCSGNSLYKLITDTSEEEWDALFAVHIKSAFLISRRLIPYMIRRRWGRILLISSIWGEAGAAMEVAYSAAKGAVGLYTKALAKELAPSGITVNAIAPGAIDTPMMREDFAEEEIKEIAGRIPAGRLGTPEEVAHLARFLIREESAYITGQILHVNGGWL
ncbi:elongation factor P 5-aminopentanone reductase [Thermicanus aegyptius]|uniref:elongation factor P 5-aminopentanone reductase n=1 Tax=Thermicanus aegyptius TaxID=94009 RepID=UPI0004141E62|nr:SDR family oxidoreductase [Thermicanus aegyptius]